MHLTHLQFQIHTSKLNCPQIIVFQKLFPRYATCVGTRRREGRACPQQILSLRTPYTVLTVQELSAVTISIKYLVIVYYYYLL